MSQAEELARKIHNAIAEEAIHQGTVPSWTLWHELRPEDRRVMTFAIDGLIQSGVIQ